MAHRSLVQHIGPLSIAFVLATGCYVPASRQYQPTGKQRPDALIGKAASAKPIKLGKTTLAEALPLLQKAINGSTDAPPVDLDDRFLLRTERRQLAVTFSVLTGKWITVGDVSPTGATRWLVLDFDSDGIVTRSRTLELLPSDGAESFHPFAYTDSDRLFGSDGVKRLQSSGTLMSDAQRGLVRRGGERKLRQQMEQLRLELEAEHSAATQMAVEPSSQPSLQPPASSPMDVVAP